MPQSPPISSKEVVIIVGAGLSGSVSARLLAERGFKVFVLEKRDHIAGNCFDYINEHGIRVSKYGAHLFHTDSERVWKFVSKFANWKRWEHTVVASIEDKIVPVPPNITTVNVLFDEALSSKKDMNEWLAKERGVVSQNPKNGEEAALARVGRSLYEKIFKHYTFKQWSKYPVELNASVLQRLPVRDDWDTRYFNDKYQALPAEGYTSFVANILDHPEISVLTSVDFFEIKDNIWGENCYLSGEWREKLSLGLKDRQIPVIYTGPIDKYFSNSGLAKLEYRSICFDTKHIKMKGFHQTNSVVNFPSPGNGNITRTVEYKHFLCQKSDYTTIVSETTVSEGEPYYPVPNARNMKVYQMYQDLASREKQVFFLGRLASYKYFNMDQAVLNALEFWDDKFLNISK